MKKLTVLLAILVITPLTRLNAQSFNFTMTPPSWTFTNAPSTITVQAGITNTAAGATSYSWTVASPVGCTATLAMTNPTLATMQTSCCGVFTVTAYAYNGSIPVTNVAHTYSVNCPLLTKIGSENGNDIGIYPNPCASLVRISGANISHIILSDLTGKQVRVENRMKDDVYDVSRLPVGLYFIEVYSEDRVVRTDKLIISRQ
jgi:hypothetical protein